MGITTTATITETVSNHIADTEFEAFDTRTVERAKVRILDSLGNIAAGHRAQGNDALLTLAGRWGGRPEATVLVHGLRVPAHAAAMVNAAMMRSYDFEAIGADGPGQTQAPAHISGTTVPVALAVAEQRHAGGRDLLTALILGDDLTARLGMAQGFDVYSGQDNTGTINGLGGTAVAGKLRGLDAAALRHGFGIVENQLAGTVANINDQSPAFKLPMAFAARNAIVSAELAELGFTGPVDAIGGKHGFLEVFGSNANAEGITAGLGEDFYGDCVIKPWSACRASHPSLDACVRLATGHNIDPDQIEQIRIHVTPRTLRGFVGQEFRPGDSPEVSGAFSIRFTAATALMYRTVRPEHLNANHMNDPRLLRLLDKISLVDSLAPGEILTAEVELTLSDGSRLHCRVDDPLGDIHKNPLSARDISDKYYANVEFGGRISRSSAERAADIVDRLESLEDVSTLVALFTPDTH
ncbi:MmgE/PrpD family protein [Arthrobacter gengyunqii]|uniref:MmgE/PrpD family protein n=1 Tax=Arthrobacter gengyunqii TaxID=2886940 RepID=A0ABS8GHK6_9MICC|nr:MmgE/PrpD family protein [Arthrobacter gengyunqii]MCC3266040.1 MmgE/PrpD family protein [Arthrobacter gengyunqii]